MFCPEESKTANFRADYANHQLAEVSVMPSFASKAEEASTNLYVR